ncbi:MAG: 5-deoxy-glucuronate isomerase [bacterium]|nr:5-deoxy-glucuronate isomerase [bacterium]MCX7916524.1 5-deoxy-glucuronate isomerase [bacterium]MDW8164035.1 5-deoxy-glucuronate isomerase [Candidatus Omnitrophota bacterium]
MAVHIKIEEKNGYSKILTPENSDLKYLSFSILRQEKGFFSGNTEKEETAFIITEGKCNFYVEKNLIGIMKRKDVFEEPPTAVYLPPYYEFTIEFEKKTEICMVGCKAKGLGKPKFINSKEIRFRRVGEETYFRNITDIITETFPAERLLIGETINDPGNWSSYPPHKHDIDNPPEEYKLEELYFFKIHPPKGFGIIRIFNEKEDNLFLIKNNEIITIPTGYHPVGVIPKHQIYYLWALAGEKRILKPKVHPDFNF